MKSSLEFVVLGIVPLHTASVLMLWYEYSTNLTDGDGYQCVQDSEHYTRWYSAPVIPVIDLCPAESTASTL